MFSLIIFVGISDIWVALLLSRFCNSFLIASSKTVLWEIIHLVYTLLFYKQRLFSAQPQCCLTFLWIEPQMLLKISEYPFKQNKNMLKNMAKLSYTNFYNISLNVLRPTFFNIYNLPFLRSPNIGKIRVKVGSKTDYFAHILSSCTNTIAVFNDFFSLMCSQPRDKQNRARDFLLSKYFLHNLLLTVLMQNTLSKLIELLQ